MAAVIYRARWQGNFGLGIQRAGEPEIHGLAPLLLSSWAGRAVIPVMDEYLAVQLARDRAAEVEAGLRQTAYLQVSGLPPRSAPGRVVEVVRRALTVRDLGRLALVSFLVMLLGVGVVGLWTAATEPRPPRTKIDLP